MSVRNSFSSLLQIFNDVTPDTRNKTFIGTHKKAAEEHVPWENQEIRQKRQTLKESAELKNKVPTLFNI